MHWNILLRKIARVVEGWVSTTLEMAYRASGGIDYVAGRIHSEFQKCVLQSD